MRWAYEFYHPHFGWLVWESGDKTWSTKRDVELVVRNCPYRVRIVRVEDSKCPDSKP